MFNRKYIFNSGSFSIARLVYQRWFFLSTSPLILLETSHQAILRPSLETRNLQHDAKGRKSGPKFFSCFGGSKRQTLKMMCSEDDRDDPLTRFKPKKIRVKQWYLFSKKDRDENSKDIWQLNPKISSTIMFSSSVPASSKWPFDSPYGGHQQPLKMSLKTPKFGSLGKNLLQLSTSCSLEFGIFMGMQIYKVFVERTIKLCTK